MKLPKKFTVTITEADRHKASFFSSPCYCLVATAVRRHLKLKLSEHIEEWINTIFITGVEFKHTPVWYDSTEPVIPEPETKPFYAPSVVGKKIHFVREEKK